MKNSALLLFSLLSICSCTKNDDGNIAKPPETMYVPSSTGNDWKITTVSGLGWNQKAIQPLKDFLDEKNTKSFMILVNGKIAMEEYFNGHSPSAVWEWNSAGKTLVSATTGIAQQEGLLNISKKVSDYLGTEWTNMPIGNSLPGITMYKIIIHSCSTDILPLQSRWF